MLSEHLVFEQYHILKGELHYAVNLLNKCDAVEDMSNIIEEIVKMNAKVQLLEAILEIKDGE